MSFRILSAMRHGMHGVRRAVCGATISSPALSPSSILSRDFSTSKNLLHGHDHGEDHSGDKFGSPIEIDLDKVKDEPPYILHVMYPEKEPKGAVVEVVGQGDHGPSLEVDLSAETEPAYTVTVRGTGYEDPLFDTLKDGDTYKLLQLHYHFPEEHKRTLGGDEVTSPIELHLFNKSLTEDKYLGIGVMFKLGERNPALDAVLKAMSDTTSGRVKYPEDFNVYDFMPPLARVGTTDMLTYMGGKTSPPYTPRIPFFIFTEELEVSEDQVAKMKHILGNNSRAVQDLNGRNVYRTTGQRLGCFP